MDKCFLCPSQCNRDYVQGGPELREYIVQCARCGEYIITRDVDMHPPEGFIADHLYLLSSVARRCWDRKERLQIDAKLLYDPSEFESRILSQCPKRTQDKMNVILRYIAEKSKCPGYAVRINPDEECTRLYCKNGLEMMFFLETLDEQHLIGLNPISNHADATLTADGWTRMEELERTNVKSKQAFVAMWFDKQLDSAYKDGILKLEEDTGFRMLRVDAKQFNDKICDHIVAEIRRSRFVIADVTRHRRAVYFEAGYAMGLGLEVIWTCREDHMKRAERIFDTRQYNHIVWTTPEDLREKLRDRILATIG